MAIDPRCVIGSEEWNTDRANEYRKIFGIHENNTLKLTSYSNNDRHMRDDDDYSFVEKDQDGNVIAIYEAWHHMSTPKSFSVSSGYKKFTPDGVLIEEVKK